MTTQLQDTGTGNEHKLIEALQQQTATADVLRIISSGNFDLPQVLDTLLASAARLCEADIGTLRHREGERYNLAATYGCTTEWRADFERYSTKPDRGSVYGRTIIDGRTVHIPDVLADPDFTRHAAQHLMGFRTALGVPLVREGNVIGVLILFRFEPRSFTEQQVSLVETFANQAVIAIENVRLFTELQTRNRELTDSLEQQTATSEVLRVISSSPTDPQPVFQMIARSGARLCDAQFCNVFRLDEGQLHFVAYHGLSDDAVAAMRNRWPRAPDEGTAGGRAVLTGGIAHIPDVRKDPTFSLGDVAEIINNRAIVAVPILRGTVPLGAIVAMKPLPGPFPQRQIELLRTFAEQAVIAIENVRLFTELESRNREFSDALQQQTATSEVLSVMSRSPSDLQPVLDAIVATAARLCHAEWAVIFKCEPDGTCRVAAASEVREEFFEFLHRHPPVPDRGKVFGRVIIEKRTIHLADVLEDPEYSWRDAQAIGGWRTALGVPLMREGAVIGVICLQRNVVKPFTDKEIAIVTTFADQAVIAIENVRLFNELEARNRDLSEALQQQTATSEVLKAISRSTFDLQTVLDSLVQAAARLCDADHAWLFRREGEAYRWAASYGHSRDDHQRVKEFMLQQPIHPGRGTLIGRTAIEGRPTLIPDILADPEYTWAEAHRVANYRTTFGTPLLRDGIPIGVLALTRTEVRPFTDKQIELAVTFADQAVIAIENVRLFDEVQARTRELARSVEELRALDEVSQALGSTLDLQTVLATIVSRAVELSGSYSGIVYEFDEADQVFHARAVHRISKEHLAALQAEPVRLGEGAVGRAAMGRKLIQVSDIDAQSPLVAPQVRSILAREGLRSLIAIPLVRDDRVLGGLVILRQEGGAISDEVIGILRTFAAHSVLAIQNAGLFREIEEKGRQLEEVSRHKSQFLANMSHELRTPLNAILGYAELLLDGIYGEVPEKMLSVLERIEKNGRHLLGLINDVLDLSKIEAGQLTLAIAKYSLAEVVQSVHSAVETLAAEKGLGFRALVPSELPIGQGDERRIAQVLLNLVGNAIKFTDQGEVTIEAELVDGTFRIAVRDTGPGIAATDQEMIFGEFQQADNSSTRKKGGSGLGLAISKRIVEMHGGHIGVESVPGQGATFTVMLPVAVEQQREQ